MGPYHYEGFSFAIRRISACNSGGMGGRPGRDLILQDSLHPARCQRINVAGLTTASTSRQSNSRDSTVRAIRVAASIIAEHNLVQLCTYAQLGFVAGSMGVEPLGVARHSTTPPTGEAKRPVTSMIILPESWSWPHPTPSLTWIVSASPAQAIMTSASSGRPGARCVRDTRTGLRVVIAS
jgi:hypothetical protein